MLAVIQARSNSKRLKNKVLHLINRKPLIWHVINNVKKAKGVSKVVVATSDTKHDNKLVKYLKKIKIENFRGDLKNVTKRLLDTAIQYKKKNFIRINGDSPLIYPEIIDKVINIHKKKTFKKYDLITNVFPRSFPKGNSVEILKTSILKNYLHKMSQYEAEHVTKYFYNNSSKFKIKNLRSLKDQKKTKLSVDTKDDMIKLKKLLKLKKNS